MTINFNLKLILQIYLDLRTLIANRFMPDAAPEILLSYTYNDTRTSHSITACVTTSLLY